MRKLSCVLVCALAVLAVGSARATEPALQAGFGVRSIVPPPEMMSDVWSVVGGKHPTMVLDQIEARAVALGLPDAPDLIIISLDLLGLFYDDVTLIRRGIREQLGDDVHVIVASTHTHSSIDTLGIYGEEITSTGIHDDYQALVRARAIDAAVAAAADMEDATMRIGRLDAPAGYNEYDRNRHPGSFDDGVTAIRFDAASGVKGTIVNWASHPELIDPDASNDPAIPPGNVVISSDYVHTLRTTVEAGGGGSVLFLNGPIGAVTALAMPIIDPETSAPFPRRSVAKARHVGDVIGGVALDALAAGETVTPTDARIATRVFHLPVENEFILAIRAIGTLPRQMYAAEQPVPFGRDVRTEMVLVELGPLQFLTVPGEMQPDLYTGGYLPDDETANPDVPPERAIAPQMTGAYRFIVGLGQDELGYFVSATDYVWPTLYPPYGEGEDRNGVDHYQETLSLGRDTARALSQVASLLLDTEPEGDYLAYPGGFLDASGRALYGEASADVRGIWIDSSRSGRFEFGEDAASFAGAPGSSAYGFLDSRARDLGTEPSFAARGVWLDGDDDGSFSANTDPHLFFDAYALGEDEPQP